MGIGNVTTLLIYLASVIEKADEQVLPAVYYFAGRAWGATPSELGKITLCRALVQALASPLSGILGDSYDRTVVIAIGCMIWGVMTSAIAIATTVKQSMAFAAVNGLGLSLVIPCSQSVIADLHSPTFRGRAFGWMQLTAALGAVGGGMFATNVGHYSPFGMDGWRFALHIIALLSVLTGFQYTCTVMTGMCLGLLVWFCAIDPKKGEIESIHDRDDVNNMQDLELLDSDNATATGSLATDMRRIITIPSFGIIILQGVIGTLPWNAMVFFTLWFQLLGFSDFTSSLLLSTFNTGCAFGGILGGNVADFLSRRHPDSGRVMTAQISCLAGLPLFFVLFKMLPEMRMASRSFLFGLVLLALGLLISWNGYCCNAPMFSELVPQRLYSKIYAFDRSFEGAIASMAAPLVGYIAEKYFGFSGSIGENKGHESMNANALGDSLFTCITIPLILCCISYSGLYWTFPRDRRKVKEDFEIEM